MRESDSEGERDMERLTQTLMAHRTWTASFGPSHLGLHRSLRPRTIPPDIDPIKGTSKHRGRKTRSDAANKKDIEFGR